MVGSIQWECCELIGQLAPEGETDWPAGGGGNWNRVIGHRFGGRRTPLAGDFGDNVS